MKKMKKTLFWTFIAIVLMLDVVLTVYLLSYNQYNVSTFGDKTLLVMTTKLSDYDKGDLLLITKVPNSEFKVGDQIFFYDTSSKESVVNYGKINKVNENPKATNSFIMSNDFLLSDENVIGKTEDVKVYAGVGAILGFIASKWVFLFIVIIPILILFIYELYLLIAELKKAKK